MMLVVGRIVRRCFWMNHVFRRSRRHGDPSAPPLVGRVFFDSALPLGAAEVVLSLLESPMSALDSAVHGTSLKTIV